MFFFRFCVHEFVNNGIVFCVFDNYGWVTWSVKLLTIFRTIFQQKIFCLLNVFVGKIYECPALFNSVDKIYFLYIYVISVGSDVFAGAILVVSVIRFCSGGGRSHFHVLLFIVVVVLNFYCGGGGGCGS